MRHSLEFVGQAPRLEPSESLTAGILLKGQMARRDMEARLRQRSTAAMLVKALACAAGIVVVAALYFGAALDIGDGTGVVQAASSAKQVADVVPSLATLRQAVADMQTLTAAVSAPSRTSRTLWERQHLHAVRVLDADIAAALAALERHPGCTRASNLLNANIQRQAETLRTLYIERSL